MPEGKSEYPVCHLVWLQGRRAPDDVEDYYEVARPGDKCVDGSDPFPVYIDPAPKSQWQDISTYQKEDRFTTTKHILCGHSEKKWVRMGRWYPEVGKWYYSGTNERSQWAQVEGDAPTHWMPLVSPPSSTEES